MVAAHFVIRYVQESLQTLGAYVLKTFDLNDMRFVGVVKITFFYNISKFGPVAPNL